MHAILSGEQMHPQDFGPLHLFSGPGRKDLHLILNCFNFRVSQRKAIAEIKLRRAFYIC